MTDDTELQKILRYVSGECTPEAAAELRAWIEADPGRRAQAEAWQRVREAADARPPAWNTEAALVALRGELNQCDPRGRPARPPLRVVAFPPSPATPGRRTVVYVFRLAAAVLVAVGVGTLWRLGGAPAGDAARIASTTLREYTTPRGQRAELRLVDGTRVLLGADTRLRAPHDFGAAGRRREVELDGEAYFEVTHDETRPFVVRTARGMTEDLGTVFSIRAYRGDDTERIVVAEGKVAVHAAGTRATPHLLTAGQLARVASDGAVEIERKVDLSPYLAWTNGRLVFRRTPLPEAIAQLERWYDIEIDVASPELMAKGVSGPVMEHEPVLQVLRVIATVVHAEAVPTGPRRYTLRAKR